MLHIIWIIKNKSQSDLNLACENKGGKLEKKRMNIKENKEHCAWALFLTLSPTTSWAKFSIRGPSRLISSPPQPLLWAHSARARGSPSPLTGGTNRSALSSSLTARTECP